MPNCKITVLTSSTVKLTDLPVPQLSQLKKQFDDELSNLTSSFQSLRQAQAKFKDCLLSLQKGVKKENEGRTILVPLTSSLYVPGRLEGVEKVIVDVGEWMQLSSLDSYISLW